MTVAISDHCITGEKHILFALHDSSAFQATLGVVIRDVITAFPCPDALTEVKAKMRSRLPQNANPYAFFARKSEEFEAAQRERRPSSFSELDLVSAPTKAEETIADYHLRILMPAPYGRTQA